MLGLRAAEHHLQPSRFPLTTTDRIPRGVFERKDELPPAQPQKSKPTVAPQASKPAPARPDEHDWRTVADALYLAFNQRDQEIDLEARMFVRAFGDAARPEDVVEVVLPKVRNWQIKHYSRVVLGDLSTTEHLNRWATWWIAKHLGRSGRPQTPSKPIGKYTDEHRAKSQRTRGQSADAGAAQAQALRLDGSTKAQIAKQLKVCLRTVAYWFKRFINPELLQRAISAMQLVCTASSTYRNKSISRHALEKNQATAPAQPPEHGENRTWYRNRSGRTVRLAFAIPDYMIHLNS